jgi:hypothetical protein
VVSRRVCSHNRGRSLGWRPAFSLACSSSCSGEDTRLEQALCIVSRDRKTVWSLVLLGAFPGSARDRSGPDLSPGSGHQRWPSAAMARYSLRRSWSRSSASGLPQSTESCRAEPAAALLVRSESRELSSQRRSCSSPPRSSREPHSGWLIGEIGDLSRFSDRWVRRRTRLLHRGGADPSDGARRLRWPG